MPVENMENICRDRIQSPEKEPLQFLLANKTSDILSSDLFIGLKKNVTATEYFSTTDDLGKAYP